MDRWRARAFVCAWLVLACASACAPEALKAVEIDNTDDTRPEECPVSDGEAGAGRSCGAVHRDVDLVFVIDNSGSMGDEQVKLLESAESLIDVLETKLQTINYRIAFTTTDNGHPYCGAGTTPEGGQFVLESCRGRLEHFVFTPGGSLPVDVGDVACTNWCDLEPDDLDDRLVPTTTDYDPDPRVRPWIESIDGQTNLPDGVSTLDAFRCFAPQGIDGCGFESHLESMYKALQRPLIDKENSYGFHRDDALLVVVILTDEVDCSYNSAYEEIFHSDGAKLFWSDPDAQRPTAAVCWNAGVECSGGPGTYDECHAADYGIDGLLTNDPEAAVLRPVSRYTDLLQAIEDRKQMSDPSNEIIVSIIAGVPHGYGEGSAELVYADAEDPGFQAEFGIGPGCMGADGDLSTYAVPPVRLREFAEALGQNNLHSVCADDYGHALDELEAAIKAHIRPACYPECVLDLDLDTPGLQPECVVEQDAPGEPASAVPRCDVVDDEYVLPGDEDDVCYGLRTDPEQTGPTHDDMSDECVEKSSNLEFIVIRRAGVPAPGGTGVSATCQLSDDPAGDCPGL